MYKEFLSGSKKKVLLSCVVVDFTFVFIFLIFILAIQVKGYKNINFLTFCYSYMLINFVC